MPAGDRNQEQGSLSDSSLRGGRSPTWQSPVNYSRGGSLTLPLSLRASRLLVILSDPKGRRRIRLPVIVLADLAGRDNLRCSSVKIFPNIFEKMLDNCHPLRYNDQAVSENAAIAQSVERILGKDEVASSNLASSSIKHRPAHLSGSFFYSDATPDLNSKCNANERCPLGSAPAEPLFCSTGAKCKQI